MRDTTCVGIERVGGQGKVKTDTHHVCGRDRHTDVLDKRVHVLKSAVNLFTRDVHGPHSF